MDSPMSSDAAAAPDIYGNTSESSSLSRFRKAVAPIKFIAQTKKELEANKKKEEVAVPEVAVPEDMFFDALVSYMRLGRVEDDDIDNCTDDSHENFCGALLGNKCGVWDDTRRIQRMRLKVLYQAVASALVLSVIWMAFAAAKSEGMLGAGRLDEPRTFTVPISCDSLELLPSDIGEEEFQSNFNRAFYEYKLKETADRLLVQGGNQLFDRWNTYTQDELSQCRAGVRVVNYGDINVGKYPCQVLEAHDSDGRTKIPQGMMMKVWKGANDCRSASDQFTNDTANLVPLNLTVQNSLMRDAKYMVQQMFGINCVIGSLLPQLLKETQALTVLWQARFSWGNTSVLRHYSMLFLFLVSSVLWYIVIPVWIMQLSVIVVIESETVVDIVKDCLALVFISEVGWFLRFTRNQESYTSGVRVRDFEQWKDRISRQVFYLVTFPMNYYLIVVVYLFDDVIDPSVGLNPAKHHFGWTLTFCFVLGVFFLWVSRLTEDRLNEYGEALYLNSKYVNIPFWVVLGIELGSIPVMISLLPGAPRMPWAAHIGLFVGVGILCVRVAIYFVRKSFKHKQQRDRYQAQQELRSTKEFQSQPTASTDDQLDQTLNQMIHADWDQNYNVRPNKYLLTGGKATPNELAKGKEQVLEFLKASGKEYPVTLELSWVECDRELQEGDHVASTMLEDIRKYADARGVVRKINEDGSLEITWDSSVKCPSRNVERRWVRWVPDREAKRSAASGEAKVLTLIGKVRTLELRDKTFESRVADLEALKLADKVDKLETLEGRVEELQASELIEKVQTLEAKLAALTEETRQLYGQRQVQFEPFLPGERS